MQWHTKHEAKMLSTCSPGVQYRECEMRLIYVFRVTLPVRFLPSYNSSLPVMPNYYSEKIYEGPETIVVAMDIGTTHSEQG